MCPKLITSSVGFIKIKTINNTHKKIAQDLKCQVNNTRKQNFTKHHEENI